MKTKIIISTSVILLVIAAIVCFLPRSTRISQTFNAVKLDQNGSEICTVEISVSGQKLDYPRKDPRLIISIAPFDIYDRIQAAEWVDQPKGYIRIYPGTDLWHTSFSAARNDTKEIDDFYLFISPEWDRFAIVDFHSNIYYVSSVEGDYSPQELFEYFRILFPVEQDSKS